MSAIDTLLERHTAFVAGHEPMELPTEPRLRLAIVSCMDSRLDIFAALGLQIGEAHVIRNAGGIATDDVLRSLALSQQALGTREVLVIQHTRCGLHGLDEDGFADRLRAATGEAAPFPMGAFADLPANVRASVESIRHCPFLPHRDGVRGFVYDVSTSALHEIADRPGVG